MNLIMSKASVKTNLQFLNYLCNVNKDDIILDYSRFTSSLFIFVNTRNEASLKPYLQPLNYLIKLTNP